MIYSILLCRNVAGLFDCFFRFFLLLIPRGSESKWIRAFAKIRLFFVFDAMYGVGKAHLSVCLC